MAWFPVHCTSINNTNALISGDNKGVASQLLEAWADGGAGDPSTDPVLNIRSPGRGGTMPGFVAAFGQANVGDTSPNVLGAFCADTGALPSWLPWACQSIWPPSMFSGRRIMASWERAQSAASVLLSSLLKTGLHLVSVQSPATV